MTTATSGVLARFPLLLPVRNSFASYGASASLVLRTEDIWQKLETNVIEVIGFSESIRVSTGKETLLTLNVHFCVVVLSA